MPIYVYKTEDGDTFEVYQSFNDPPLSEHPENGKRVTRVITTSPPIFYRTHGFYATDAKREGKG